ncbi:MAG: peptide ABC transporter substrate-binding protein [Lachnospira sp.]
MKRGKLFKKLTAVTLTLATVLGMMSFTGCKSGTSTGSVSTGKSITIQMGNTEGDLDPAGVALGKFIQYSRLCLEPLVTYDSNGKLQYCMAKSYTVSDDGLVWTFKLREDGKWNDGSTVTSKDFLNTIKRALDAKTSTSIYADMLSPIVGASEAYAGKGSVDNIGVKTPDDFTIEFTLTSPCSYFLKLVCLQCCYPSKDGVATAANSSWYTNPATNFANGAYYMTEYVEGQYYKLAKNPNYYDADKVQIEEITVKQIDDATAAASAYKTGELDMATNLPAYIISEYKGKDDLVLQPNVTTRFILFNEEKAPFDNVNVRLAITTALNREDICKSVGEDYVASTSFVGKSMLSNLGNGMKFSDESGELVTESETKAKEYLAAAGYPDGAGFPTVTYNYPNNEQDKLIAQAIQAQLKKVLNINVELNGLESQVCVSERKAGNFGMTRHNWTADYDDPMDYLLMWVSSSGLNDGKIFDSDYDKLCADATAEMDANKRNELMHKAEKLLVTEKAYVAPISTFNTVTLINSNYTGYTFDSSGAIVMKFLKAK